MYCMHKPGDGHIAWLSQKAKFKQQHAAKKATGSCTPATPTPTPLQASTPTSSIGDSAKLSFQSLFNLLWWPKLVFLRINLRRLGMMLALPQETRWPWFKDGDYNVLCSTSIHFALLGCHLNPFSTMTFALSICQLPNFNHSTDYSVVTI